MRTKNLLVSGTLGIALAGLVLTGCHKNSTTTPASTDSDITAAQDESNASYAANDTKTVSDACVQTGGSGLAPERSPQAIYSQHCTVSWDTLNPTTDTMYVNFGASPVLCNDLVWRQGEIIVYWNKAASNHVKVAYFDSGTTINMTFRGYYVGTVKDSVNGISGNRNWTNEGHNIQGYENWNFNANLVITYPSKQTATWNSSRDNVLTEVNSVWYYAVSGSATGVTRNNVTYNLTITSPLYVTAKPWWLDGCAWIESGIVSITRPALNNNTLTINFGNIGDCDDKATATLDNKSYTIYLW